MNSNNISLLILFIASPFVSLASAWITRLHWPSEVEGLLTVVITAVGGFASEWAAHPAHYQLGWAVLRAAGAYIVAAIVHSKVWTDGALINKAAAFPRKVPPNGVQPGHEPDMPLAA